ncbi:c-type cytochrome [Moraxella sp. Pampa]|uniref:c-type cytochrome n=1 Tax=Moraxella sp. Pampa TaxID=3111978 RepID=UPI002B4182E8|nr:c-type cytochrome [Moraxella sp. Pampa]
MMTMKKIVILSAAATLAIFTMASQAQEATKPATDIATESSEVAATTTESEAAALVEKKAEEVIAEDSDQVKKLIALYPKLISRIAPYGKVCFDGEECDINITVLAAAVEGEARPGDMLYKAICATCHDAGLIGAPKIGTADWSSRIAKGKDTLYNHAINGFNAMPARGGADISDDEVKNAVDYIISQLQ